MMEQFERIIKKHTAPGEKLAVAVSGGADSMCLLTLCLTSPLIENENISVVSIDHKIRGEHSEKDLKFVEAFCLGHGVKFLPFTVDIPLRCKISGRGIEAEARAARYEIFSELLASGETEKVLTAHHRADDAESVLMHLLRGSGIRGLCGIEENRNGILRPLLNVEKQDIDAFVLKHRIPYVTDETNADCGYTRNFVRNELFPLMRGRYQGTESAVLRLKEEASAVMREIERRIDKSRLILEADDVKIPVSVLEDEMLAPHYFHAAMTLKFADCTDMEFVHIKAVCGLSGARNGAGVDLPHGLRAVREYEFVTIYRAAANQAQSINDMPFAVGVTEVGGVKVFVEACESLPDFYKNHTENPVRTLYFDRTKLPPGAVFRARRNGDRFCPYGGKTKKLKEYLIDKKIPERQRDGLICIADADEVLAVIGVEISDKVKVEAHSEVYLIRIETE